MMGKLFDLSTDKYGIKTLVHILIGIFVFMASQLLASLVVDTFYEITRFEIVPILLLARCFFEVLFFVIAIKIYIGKVLNLDLKQFRISRKGVSLISIIVAIMLPCGVVAFFLLLTEGDLVIAKRERIIIAFAAAIKVAVSAGITEELLFRGYIMKLVEQRWNKLVAITVPSIIFALLHSVKIAGAVNISLLLVAGTLVGSMFSVIALMTNNVFDSMLVHGTWNFIVIGIMNISPHNQGRAIFYFDQKTTNVLLTGGDYGVESSIVAIVGYCLVIGVYLLFAKKKESI